MVLRNHVFNAGLYSGDVSVTYLPTGPYAAGTELAYNWIHWAPTALGMRCDSQGNGVTIHHNVIWDCGTGCKWQGWGPFNVVNNTYFSDSLFFDGNDGTNGVDIEKNSDVMNNIFVNSFYFRGPPLLNYASYPAQNNDHFKDNVKVDKPYAGNVFYATNMFVSTDSATLDLRPKSGSVLIDNGAVVAGITDGYVGAAPDIGAYEYGGEYWVPGAHWLNDGWPVPTTMAAATALAAQILATAGPPQPGIAVSGNGDFGTVAIGGYTEQTFTVTNTAYINLLLTGSPPVQITGDPEFTVSSNVSSTNIAVGGSTTFTVRFSPTAEGTFSGVLLIANNTTNNNPCEFSVSGNSSDPWALQVEYLIVGGGGAGGSLDGGGGGAGGLFENFGSPQPMEAASYAVVVGDGGAATGLSGGNGGDDSRIRFHRLRWRGRRQKRIPWN